MAKELPFFMFEPAEWMFGRIQKQSDEVKAAFVDLLCKYWHKRCDMSYGYARLDFGDVIDVLISQEIISVDEDANIGIKFLDEQMESINETSRKNSEAGRASAAARKQAFNARSTPDKQIRQDKTIQNKTKEDNKIYSKAVNDCLKQCLTHFPDYLIPINSNLSKWADVIDKLNRIDNIPFEKIVEVVEKTRNNEFWKKNFLSLNKLRQKDKNGIKYFIVFEEQIKPNERKQNYKSAEQFIDAAKGIASRVSQNS